MNTRSPDSTTWPTVTVVIPCYNYGRYLPGVVSSVLRQRRLQIEILIINDRSSDDSAAVARGLTEAHKNVRLIDHEQNMGHIATYNEGLGQVSTKYVVLLSADDLVAENALSRAVDLMERHPAVGLVYGYSLEIFGDDNPEPVDGGKNGSTTIWSGQDWIRECCRQGKNMVQTPEVVMRTEVYAQIGGYERDFPHAADFYMWLRSAARADVGRVNGVTQAYYRVHGQNMHIQDFPGVITDLRERRKAFDRFFATDGHLLSDPHRLHRLAERGMSNEAIRLAVGATLTPEPDLETAADFADLAVDLRPGVATTLRWRLYQRSRLGVFHHGLRQILRLTVRTYQDLFEKYRWRRWRRTGL